MEVGGREGGNGEVCKRSLSHVEEEEGEEQHADDGPKLPADAMMSSPLPSSGNVPSQWASPLLPNRVMHLPAMTPESTMNRLPSEATSGRAKNYAPFDGESLNASYDIIRRSKPKEPEDSDATWRPDSASGRRQSLVRKSGWDFLREKHFLQRFTGTRSATSSLEADDMLSAESMDEEDSFEEHEDRGGSRSKSPDEGDLEDPLLSVHVAGVTRPRRTSMKERTRDLIAMQRELRLLKRAEAATSAEPDAAAPRSPQKRLQEPEEGPRADGDVEEQAHQQPAQASAESAKSSPTVKKSPIGKSAPLTVARGASKLVGASFFARFGVAENATKKEQLFQISAARHGAIDFDGPGNNLDSLGALKHSAVLSAMGQRKYAERVRGERTVGKRLPFIRSVKVLLQSDHNKDDFVDLIYEPKKLQKEVKHLLNQEKKDRAQDQMRAKQALTEMRSNTPGKEPTKTGDSVFEEQYDETEEEWRRAALGFGMSKKSFLEKAKDKSDLESNKLIIARLMQTLADLSLPTQDGGARGLLRILDCYHCLDPEAHGAGAWFMSLWTVVYIGLIFYIATAGLYFNTFADLTLMEDPSAAAVASSSDACENAFTGLQWWDAAVDGFFVLDFAFRCLLFGQVKTTQEESSGYMTRKRIIRKPSEVITMYAKSGMAFDVLTGFPYQWLGMILEQQCGDAGSAAVVNNARFLRVVRMARIVKVFKIARVQKALKQIKRKMPSTNMLQLFELFVGLAFLTHIWTCLTWFIKTSGTPDSFGHWLSMIGIEDGADREDTFLFYSVCFTYTLQVLFSINPFLTSATLDSWFGSLTIVLSVFISATVLSKILDIWEAINKAQTEKDNKINAVKRFMHVHSIKGELRDSVLDYFDFQTSISFGEFEKHLLDELPVDVRAKIVRQLFPKALQNSRLFQGVGDAFISQLVLRLARNPFRAMPGQVIVSQGMIGEEMFLLKSGTVKVTIQDHERGGDETIRILHAGTCFGEGSLWMEARRTATVTCVDFCQVYVLTRQDLEEVLNSFPELKNTIAKNAMSLCLRTKGLCPGLTGISEEVAENIATVMASRKVVFHDGDLLARAGKVQREAFIIRKGQALSDSFLDKEHQIRCVGFTELFGFQKMLNDVVARGKVVAYKVTLEDLPDVFKLDLNRSKQVQRTALHQYKLQRREMFQHLWRYFAEHIILIKTKVEIKAKRKNNLRSFLQTSEILHSDSHPRSKGVHTIAKAIELLQHKTDTIDSRHSSMRPRSRSHSNLGRHNAGNTAEVAGERAPKEGAARASSAVGLSAGTPSTSAPRRIRTREQLLGILGSPSSSMDRSPVRQRPPANNFMSRMSAATFTRPSSEAGSRSSFQLGAARMASASSSVDYDTDIAGMSMDLDRGATCDSEALADQGMGLPLMRLPSGSPE